MQKLFLSSILLLLFSVINIEAKGIAGEKDKNSLTNSLIAKKISDKKKVDKKKKVFDKNLNLALLTDEELNQLINDALRNCNNAELMELGTKLGIAQKYDLTPIISSAIVARTKCDVKKARQRCIYATKCFFRDFSNGTAPDETRKIMDEAINGVPIGCQDWSAVGQMAYMTPFAMHVSFIYDNDYNKGWDEYKYCINAVKNCKKGPYKLRKQTINHVNEKLTSFLIKINNKNKQNSIKLSLKNALEIKEFVKDLPPEKFLGSENEKQNIIKKFQKYIDEKNNSR